MRHARKRILDNAIPSLDVEVREPTRLVVEPLNPPELRHTQPLAQRVERRIEPLTDDRQRLRVRKCRHLSPDDTQRWWIERKGAMLLAEPRQSGRELLKTTLGRLIGGQQLVVGFEQWLVKGDRLAQAVP